MSSRKQTAEQAKRNAALLYLDEIETYLRAVAAQLFVNLEKNNHGLIRDAVAGGISSKGLGQTPIFLIERFVSWAGQYPDSLLPYVSDGRLPQNHPLARIKTGERPLTTCDLFSLGVHPGFNKSVEFVPIDTGLSQLRIALKKSRSELVVLTKVEKDCLDDVVRLVEAESLIKIRQLVSTVDGETIDFCDAEMTWLPVRRIPSVNSTERLQGSDRDVMTHDIYLQNCTVSNASFGLGEVNNFIVENVTFDRCNFTNLNVCGLFRSKNAKSVNCTFDGFRAPVQTTRRDLYELGKFMGAF